MYKEWKKSDDNFLELNKHLSNKFLAELLGRTEGAINMRKEILGLRKQRNTMRKQDKIYK